VAGHSGVAGQCQRASMHIARVNRFDLFPTASSRRRSWRCKVQILAAGCGLWVRCSLPARRVLVLAISDLLRMRI
jgi:hypothetical protein